MAYIYLFNFCYTEGKQALAISHAVFNKEASVKYKQLSNEERKDLEKEMERMGEQRMSKKAVNKRALRISKGMQTLASITSTVGTGT